MRNWWGRNFAPFFSFKLGARLVAVAALFLAFATAALAQSTATLQGTVTDPSGGAVPKAKVLVQNEQTGVEFNTQTDSTGSYLVTGLLPGLYQVTVTASGFQKFIVKEIKLDVASTVQENVPLKVGEVSQEVVVTGGAPLVNTTSATMGQVIDQKTVQQIPLNGRHFVDLGLLVAGTVTPPQNGFLVYPLQGLGMFAIDTAGQRENTTNWMINGINLNDGVQNQITFQPSVDTVSEFKIDNSNFPAQYGRMSGAIVNIATRSGTNQFHGEAFDFARNSFFDARNYFNPKPKHQIPLIRNDFGADGGGPIVKNKAFFFLSYEGQRQRDAAALSTLVPAQGTTSSSTAVNNLLKLLPQVPGTANTLVPFFGSTSVQVNVDQGAGDLSYVFNPSDRLHGYYIIEQDHRFEPTSAANVPNFGDVRDARRQLMTLNEVHVFSPNITNEARLGFNRLHITFLPSAAESWSSLGIGEPAGVPTTGFPLIIISGGPEFGDPPGEPQGRGDTTVDFSDTLDWLKGNHNLAMGVDVMRFYNNNIGENLGDFFYTGLASFLNDRAVSYAATQGNSNDKILEPAWAIFLQDTYKLRPNLTLEIGLRYDWNGTPNEANNHLSLFNPTTDAMAPVSQAYPTSDKNIQPRIGFAWDPWGDGKTSVRGGYAILTQQPVTNIVSALSGNPPFATPLAASGNISLEAPPVNPRLVSPNTIDPNFHDAYAQDWNLSIERALTPTLGIELSYVGIKGTHEQQLINLNQPPVTGGIYGTSANSPYPNFSEILDYNSNGNSNYNAFWATVRKRTSHGLELSASYTLSRSNDYSSLDVPNNLPQDTYNLLGEYGPSDFNATQRFVLSGFYLLPFKGSRAVSGWEFGLITQAQSGNPLTAFYSVPSAYHPFPGETLRVNSSGSLSISGDPNAWIANPSVLSSPCNSATLKCSPGTAGRNTVIGPNFVNTDFSIIKNTELTERINLQFRAEAFDVFNHPNFGDPSLTIDSANFNKIQSTRFGVGDFGSSRQIQLALMLQF